MPDLEVRPRPGEDVVVIAPDGTTLAKPTTNAAKTRTRVRNTGTWTPPVIVPAPTPDLPAGAVVLTPSQDVKWYASGTGPAIVLRGGTYRFGWGAYPQRSTPLTLMAYPGETVTIDGTGLSGNWLYLGPGATVTLERLRLRNFFADESGVIGIGDGCSLTAIDLDIEGVNGPEDLNDHLLYFHGTGTGTLVRPRLVNAPGVALHSYRGSPTVTVEGGELGGQYESALLYSGAFTFAGTRFTDPRAAWDVEVKAPATATLIGCTGTGTGGTPKVYRS